MEDWWRVSMKEGFRWCPHCRQPHALASRFCPNTGDLLDKKLLEAVDAAVVPSHPLAGTVLDQRYQILHRIGTGGMNEVFEATHRASGLAVAIKLVKDKNPESAERLKRESEIIASLSHKNICAIHDVGVMPDGRPYLVFERLEGETLAARLHGRKRLSVSVAAGIFAQILSGLERAHERGIVHRDLKPANIFLVERGAPEPLVKILDFGLAMDVLRRGTRMTRPGRAAGTPRYMAPEQLIGGKITPAADLFAVGMMFYEALAGEHPFASASAVETSHRIIHVRETDLAKRRGDLPFGLTAIVHSALGKRVSERPRSAGHMLRALAMLDELEEDEPASTDSLDTYRTAAPSSSSTR